MFGHNKFLTEGEQIDGVVTEVSVTVRHQINVKVEVRFPDGSSGEFDQYGLWKTKTGTLAQGDRVPVRYDANDHSKVAIDIPALEQRYATEKDNRVEDLAAMLRRNEERKHDTPDAQESEPA